MKGLSFLNPWLLAGLAAVAVPIIIHLINRRRAFMHRFAAIEFLLHSQRRIAAKFRLKQILLLLLRCAAVAMVCAALARPVLSTLGHTPAGGREPTSLVLILDNSYSMQYRTNGWTLFDRGRASARNLLKSLRKSDNAAIFLGPEASAASATGLSFDTGALLRDLDGAKCSFGTTDIPAWITAALPLLRDSKLPHKRLCVLTDGARHGWSGGNPKALEGALKAAGVQCDVLDVSAGARLPNMALAGLDVGRVGSEVSLVTARIANHTGRVAGGIACSVSVDGKKISSGFADAAAGTTAIKQFTSGAPAPGYHVCEVRLEADQESGLAVDDVRWVSLSAGRPVNTLVVDGAPGPHVYASETFYLERALNPDAGRGPVRATVVTEAQFATQNLTDFDAVFLCNVGTVPAAKIRELSAFVERGGGVFISVGDNVDANYYGRYLPFLPEPLRDKKDLEPAGQEGGPGKAPVSLKVVGEEGNALAQALKSAGADLSRVTVKKAFYLEATAGSQARRILSYTNDAPALVERTPDVGRTVGAGRVLLLTTTVDRDWTNLPIMPSFLPLMQLSARYLAGRMEERPQLDTLVGRAVELTLPADCKRVRLTNPAGVVREIEVSGWRPPKRLRVAETGIPGPYEIALAGMPRGDERTGFVVNLDAESESNLKKISGKELAAYGARMMGVRDAGEVDMDYLEFGAERGLWAPLLAAFLFIAAVECLLARKP